MTDKAPSPSHPLPDRIPAGSSDHAREIHTHIVQSIRALSGPTVDNALDTDFKSRFTELLNLFDRYQTQVLSDVERHQTCIAGCSSCCYHWVEDVYSFEAEIIADFIRTRFPDRIPMIIRRFQEDERALSELDEKLCENGHVDDDTVYFEQLLDEFFQLRRSCALLELDGTCSIYPVRPLTCRTYLSFSDPKLCDPANSRNGGGDTWILDMEENAANLMDRLHLQFDRFDGDTGLRSLVAKCLVERRK